MACGDTDGTQLSPSLSAPPPPLLPPAPLPLGLARSFLSSSALTAPAPGWELDTPPTPRLGQASSACPLPCGHPLVGTSGVSPLPPNRSCSQEASVHGGPCRPPLPPARGPQSCLWVSARSPARARLSRSAPAGRSWEIPASRGLGGRVSRGLPARCSLPCLALCHCLGSCCSRWQGLGTPGSPGRRLGGFRRNGGSGTW